MMDSVISICNSALRMLKVSTINSLTEGSEQARACSAVYDGARRALLRLATWNFARTFCELAAAAAWKANSLWQYAYLLPTDCLYAVRGYSSTAMDEVSGLAAFVHPYGVAAAQAFASASADVRFELGLIKEEIGGVSNQARVVFTDADGAYLEYIADVKDPKLFDPMFAKALSYNLAAELAIPLAGSAEAGSYYARLADEALASARLACANEGRRERIIPPMPHLSSGYPGISGGRV